MVVNQGSSPITGRTRTVIVLVRTVLELGSLFLLGAWAYDASGASVRWFASFGLAAVVALLVRLARVG